MEYKSDIEIVPTLEELQKSLLVAENLLADLHENGECLDNCILCQQMGTEGYIWEMDKMFKCHNGIHPKLYGYPFTQYCEYCRVEYLIGLKEFGNVN